MCNRSDHSDLNFLKIFPSMLHLAIELISLHVIVDNNFFFLK